LSYTYWFALSLLFKKTDITYQTKLRKWVLCLIGLVTIQLLYGALMAGHKAANIAATWPTINGQWVPDHLIKNDGLINAIDNPLFIHFVHRGLAYLLLILIGLFTIKLYRINGTERLRKWRAIPAIVVSAQVALGIITVLSSASIVSGRWGLFEWIAELHQLVGMLLLLVLVSLLYLIRSNKVR
jgi:cytochrome c oxidase assembly protein subunit 15